MALELNIPLQDIELILRKRKVLHKADYLLKTIRIKGYRKSIGKLLDLCKLSTYQVSENAKKFLKKKAQSICTINEYFERNSICVQMYWCTDNEMRWAVNNGAYVVVTTKQIDDLPCIITEDPLLLFSELCLYFRTLHQKVSITEVIGSIGKTTTKRMIHSVLAQQYNTLYNPTNRNLLCHVGYDVQHIPHDIHRMVEEVSEDTPGYSKYSTLICKPSTIVITTIDQSHFEAFGSKLAIAEEICSITDYADDDTVVIVNKDDFEHYDLIKKGHVVTVSMTDNSADYFANNIRVERGGIAFNIIDKVRSLNYEARLTDIYAKHNVLIALYAFASGINEGVEPELIIKGLQAFKQHGIRQNIFRTNENVLLYVDCYNAVPKSMASAINAAELIPLVGEPRRIAVLGDIAESGELAEQTHNEIIQYVNDSNFDILITLGKNLETAIKQVEKRDSLKTFECDSHFQVEETLKKLNLHEGDLVLFKSSRHARLENIMVNVFPESKILLTEAKQLEYLWRKKVIMS